MIKIIHVSDFHMENFPLSFQKEKLLEAFFLDLIDQFNPDDDNLFFIVSGDLIDKGGIGFSELDNPYERFEEVFITQLTTFFPKLTGKVFIVPGNHDIERSKVDIYSHKGIISSLNSSDSLDGFIENNYDNQISLARLKRYKDWEYSFYKNQNDLNIEYSNFEYSFVINTPQANIGVSCFNNSFLCYDDADRGNLLLGRKQITNSLKKIEKSDIKIAILHHPLGFLNEFDQRDCKVLINKYYDLLFVGHVHENDVENNTNLYGNLYISQASSTIGDYTDSQRFANGYSIIEYHKNDKVVTHFRKYLPNHSKFVPNTDIGQADGKIIFQLPKTDEVLKNEKTLQIISHLKDTKVESLNNDILLSNSYTDIPCTIENLFVEPSISNSLSESDDDTIYKIEDIIISNKNFLILGQKESGKTILLDKIFIDSLDFFQKSQKIPILIDYKDLDEDFAKIVRVNCSVSSSDVGDFIQSNKFLLIIDDFKLNGENRYNNLLNIVDNFKNVQVVLGANQAFENIIPEEFLIEKLTQNFEFVFIQNFKTKHIKELIQKWFANKQIDLQDKMQSLIKSFTDFGLPKNPLSITLFLWIFEKQEQKPINKSVLVELFIENILEKTKIENIYSGTFDFHNKRRLLAHFAKHMHDNGDPKLSYSVKFSSACSFFENYISMRAEIQPNKVLEDFINRGILYLDDESNITFKSAFYFHFFLALAFDYFKDFKEHVFTDENYLNYIEEISYYTGLRRDDEDILNYISDKLNQSYGAINQDIIENYEKVDYVLEPKTSDLLAFKIDEKKVKKIDENQLEGILDNKLASSPTIKEVEEKNITLDSKKNLDLVLKLSSVILKNSEDVDNYKLKYNFYKQVLVSSISFLMIYRDSILFYYEKNKKAPENFPKNISFNLFIKVLPLIHQVVLYEWMGTQKIRPILSEKIKEDSNSSTISELEKFISVFTYADIRGTNYPVVVEEFIESSKKKYIKDLAFLKVLSYYKLRNNNPELDKKWLDVLSKIKVDIGAITRNNRGSYIQQLKTNKTVK
ncbi:metallophosphoesterase [Myroides odoratimimus]|uniref:metallophosphoesterase n=1 Tax=Myroides odoratimimus TaxID=76832 RepID=UPI00257723E2|nr:metallophosphoesterase [Myroides odoratimimus]MDM1512962.1 metallophosphoesterase [Myroides odoratimimus]